MAVSVLFIVLAYIITKMMPEGLRELRNCVLVPFREKLKGGGGMQYADFSFSSSS